MPARMSSDERNFRSIYYEKVGCRIVEEKKSLENLLKEGIVDSARLKQFCLRFSVPHVHRSLVWKLLLGVTPMQAHIRNTVMSHRKQEFNDLHHTVQVLGITDERTPKSQVLLIMWLICTSNLSVDFNLAYEKDEKILGFLAVVKCLIHAFDDDVDIFWIARKLYENMEKIKPDIPKLVDFTYTVLEKEDRPLFKALMAGSMLDNLPLAKWIECGFAGIFHDNCLIKIWDKICGGNFKILAYLITVILITLKPRIIQIKDPANLVEYIKTIPEETADIILNKTISMWLLHLNAITVLEKVKGN